MLLLSTFSFRDYFDIWSSYRKIQFERKCFPHILYFYRGDSKLKVTILFYVSACKSDDTLQIALVNGFLLLSKSL
jgi:hypothetical protein